MDHENRSNDWLLYDTIFTKNQKEKEKILRRNWEVTENSIVRRKESSENLIDLLKIVSAVLPEKFATTVWVNE